MSIIHREAVEVPPSRHMRVGDRQDTAERLLASAARKSYDPLVEVDWAAPIPDDLYGMTPEWCSLYGTELWDRMTDEQRITLTKHEAASVAGTGIWFEMILMQMLLRDIYSHDPPPRTSSSRSTRSPTSAGTPRCSPARRNASGSRRTGPSGGSATPPGCSSRPRRARSRTAERCSPRRSST